MQEAATAFDENSSAAMSRPGCEHEANDNYGPVMRLCSSAIKVVVGPSQDRDPRCTDGGQGHRWRKWTVRTGRYPLVDVARELP